MKNICIAGTHTDVGKTAVSAALCATFGYEYFKPVQSGSKHDRDRVGQLLSDLNKDIKIHKNSISLAAPLSPHLAARLEIAPKQIEIDEIKIPGKKDVLTELAGGLYTPLTTRCFMIDIITKFSLPTFLVTREYLGSINHTMLSLAALRARKIDILGVIISGSDEYMSEILRDNGELVFKFDEFKNSDEFSLAASRLASAISKKGVLDEL